MPVFLGVDTGGTYTDAVLIRDETDVIASAKALTTRADLSLGIGQAVQKVLDTARIDPADVSLASLSTTLATNALVEGQGGRVALIFIGFGEKDLSRQGLDAALKGDPVIRLAGGHNHSGSEAAPLELDKLRAELASLGDDISGFAVASQFAVRNPAHEIAARDVIREVTGKPISCSHELSAKLGGPKRAMTAVLNARLIGMIDRLIASMEGLLTELGIEAPMKVVRGDGALISAEQAREKPIETILSGPAASIVGARWLTGAQEALVSDIGGTTTDIALLRDGRPQIDPMGAEVGGFRTMVEAVAMRTFGLGGDSEVHMAKDGLAGGLSLGPRRMIPLSLLAMDHPEVLDVLDLQLQDERAGENAGRFALRRPEALIGEDQDKREQSVLARLGSKPLPINDILTSRLDQTALDRLVAKGQVSFSAVTPSDASHVLGKVDAWNVEAARLGLALYAKQRTGAGQRLAQSAEELAQMIVDRLTYQSAHALMQSAFAEEAGAIAGDPATLASHALTQAGHEDYKGIVAIKAGLNLPVIGLGASAQSYYGAVGKRLQTKTILPDLGGVANAIGAVVGQITMREKGSIESAGEGAWRVFLGGAPEQFNAEDDALNALRQHLSQIAEKDAIASGAEAVRITFEEDIQRANIEGRDVFVSAEITAVASGRPRIAS